MKKAVRIFLAASLLPLGAPVACAQGSAPELFGVREIVVDYARFSNPKESDACGLTREDIAATFAKAFNGTGVPAMSAADAKPPSLGVARIELIPEIATRQGDDLSCTSWVEVSAENRASVVIPPVSTLRSVTVVYWRQKIMVTSSQTQHAQILDGALAKLAGAFAQQYRADQPPDLSQ